MAADRCLSIYAVFHLNMAYSSIEEEQRPEVMKRCYWPLLRLAAQYNLPFGIEASGFTLETAATIDPAWIDELRRLTTGGRCEFVGSGYAQIIGPLVPAEVNAANLRIGNQVYERLLGFRPQVALINEQAYSAGLIQHYLDAGYQAIIMEWDNPYRYHPEWDPEWRYLPQIACGQHGEEISLIWNKSIAFQKFQRYAHGEMERDEYLDYLCRHLAETARAFPLYGNDTEIIDFRPSRYHTEPVLQEGIEWKSIGRLFETLLADGRFRFIRPSQVLELMQVSGASNRLHLESPEQPIPVKKQGKYNITRWAVTGRDDLGINTACWRIYEAIKRNPQSTEHNWREVCYLWSSDFRTHITEKRWSAYLEHLKEVERRVGVNQPEQANVAITRSRRGNGITSGYSQHSSAKVERNGRYLTVETDIAKVRLNCRRGLAIDGLWFKSVSDQPLVGTLHHGYYNDISLGADFYTGHLILESPGQPKITELNPVEPIVENNKDFLNIRGTVLTPLGPIHKSINVFDNVACVELEYRVGWNTVPIGSLRIGHITLNPEAFEPATLFYRTHNGGYVEESFPLAGTNVNHGSAVSFLVSATHGIGITGGVVELGDALKCVRVEIDKTMAALIGLVTYRQVGDTSFCRLALSAGEIDETRRLERKVAITPGQYRMRLGLATKSIGSLK